MSDVTQFVTFCDTNNVLKMFLFEEYNKNVLQSLECNGCGSVGNGIDPGLLW